MKRYLHLLLIVAVAFGLVGAFTTNRPVAAQEGPTGTWYGTWPYVLPPEHHLNHFSSGGLDSNLGNVYKSFVTMPHAFYMWATAEYMPLLGESWGFSDDSTYYWTTINPDATWSNGTPVTADDVIATYQLGQILEWTQFSYIDRVEKVDERTVNYYFINGEPSLLAERLFLKEYIASAETYGDLAQQAQELIDSGAAPGDDEWIALADEIREFRPDEIIASGPYNYTMDDVGDAYMTLHWQPNSLFSDQVQFSELRLWAGETEATTPLVLSGELAHSTNVYPPSTQEAFENAGIRLITIPRGYGPALLFQHDVYPWNVTEVRQAAAMVIDRAENAFLTNGLGATPTIYMSGLDDSSSEVWIPEDVLSELDRYEFDPERAAELLRSAGFEKNDDGIWADADGVTVSAEYKFPAEFDDFSGAALNATDQMNEFGFDITPRAIPWQQCAEDIRNGNFELSVWSWASGTPFPAGQFYGPIQRFNSALPEDQPGLNFPMEFEWEGEMINLDEMINNTSAGLDIDAQKQLSGEVARIINELMPYVPLNYIVSTEPFNEDLISGGPSDDDPILQNPSGSDHFVIYYILTGVLGPA